MFIFTITQRIVMQLERLVCVAVVFKDEYQNGGRLKTLNPKMAQFTRSSEQLLFLQMFCLIKHKKFHSDPMRIHGVILHVVLTCPSIIGVV